MDVRLVVKNVMRMLNKSPVNPIRWSN